MFLAGPFLLFGGDGGESNSPSRSQSARMSYRLIRRFVSGLSAHRRAHLSTCRKILSGSQRRQYHRTSDIYRSHQPPRVADRAWLRFYAASASSLSPVTLWCHLISELVTNSACNPANIIPCRNHASPLLMNRKIQPHHEYSSTF